MVGLFQVKLKDDTTFLTVAIIFHHLIDDQDTMHYVSTLDKSKLIVINGFLEGFLYPIGEHFGKNSIDPGN